MDTNADFLDDVEDLDTASASPSPPPTENWWPEDTADDAPSRPRSKRTRVLAGIGAVAIATGSVVGINVASSKATKVGAGASAGGPGGLGAPGGAPGGQGAAGGFPGGRGGVGTIASISGSALTLSSFNGSTTKVVTSASTTVTQSATVTLADIKVGDYVVVQGLGSTTKIAANRIIDTGATAITLNQPGGGGAPGGAGANAAGNGAGGPPPNGGGFPGVGPGGGGPGGVGLGGDDDGAVFYGKVTAVSGTSLSVQSTATASTTWTVSTSSSTRYGAMTALAVSDLKTGESVAVNGTTASDGSITATNIQVMSQ